MSITLTASSGRIEITLEAVRMGDDLLVKITGGREHIGAAAVGTSMCGLPSSSVITIPGHRDDWIAKDAAERLSRSLDINTVVVAGVHYDDMAAGEIKESLRLCDELIGRLVDELCKKE